MKNHVSHIDDTLCFLYSINMDVPKTIFFLLISLIPMSDPVESRVRVPQRGNKQNEIILKFFGLEGNCLVLSLPERRESKVT